MDDGGIQYYETLGQQQEWDEQSRAEYHLWLDEYEKAEKIYWTERGMK